MRFEKNFPDDCVKSLVTLCDVHSVDCFFTQKFNQNNKITISLQHGTYTSVANAWVFKGSKSNYLLCHGKFTYDEGKRAGYGNDKKMIITGFMSYIGEDYIGAQNKKITHQGNDYTLNLGVILDGDILKEANISLLKVLSKLNNKHIRKIYLKFHPTSDISLYKKYLKNNGLKNAVMCEKALGITEFNKMIDIGIVINSTVLLELLYDDKSVFVYENEELERKTYEHAKKVSFKNLHELNLLINDYGSSNFKSEQKEMKSYFVAEGNATDNYINVFKEILGS